MKKPKFWNWRDDADSGGERSCYAAQSVMKRGSTLAYFYEHRDEADHQALTVTLRNLLTGIRKEGF